MSTRTITGTIYHPGGNTPWAGATVIFLLIEPFTVNSVVYPADTYTTTADTNGAISITLAVPDSGTALYIIRLPDGSGGLVNLGAGASVDISTLINIPADAVAENALLTAITSAVAAEATIRATADSTHAALTTTAHGGIVASSDARLTDSRTPSGAAGGDLSGTYPNPSVAKIGGITVSGTPSTGQVLKATSSSAATWQADATSSGADSTVTVVILNTDGTTDNTAAIQAAFNTMKVGGIARGKLVLTATSTNPARVATTLDFDGGLTLINQDQTAKNTSGALFELECQNPLKFDAAIGSGITFHGFAHPKITFVCENGGQWGDYGITIYDCIGVRGTFVGRQFAGTVLNLGDVAVAANLKRTIASAIDVVHAYYCGAAIHAANMQGYGVITSIWDDRSAHGSDIGVAGSGGDLTILHYENYATSSLSAGIAFANMDSLHIGKLLLGDSATWQATLTSCNMVTIEDLYLIGNKSGANTWAQASKGIQITSSAHVNIQTFKGKLFNTAIELDTSDVTISQAQLSQNYQTIHITGSGQSNLNFTGTIDTGQIQDVLIESTVPSGTIALNGRSISGNQSAGSVAIVDCLTSGVTVEVQDFLISGVNAATTNGIKHASASNLRIDNAHTLAKESIGGSVITNSFRKPDGTSVGIDSTTVFQAATDLWLYVPITLNPTGAAAATGHIRLGTTSGSQNQATPNVSAPISGEVGDVAVLTVFIPAWWYWKVQVANATVGAAYGFTR